MDTTRAEQIALDDALVAPANRLKIGKSNLRLSSDLKSKEATLQVQFEELPFKEEILMFLRDLGHSGEIKVIIDVNVNRLHQPWRSFAAVINKCLSGKTTKGKRLKATAKVTKPSKKKLPTQGLETLSEVALTEEEQMRIKSSSDEDDDAQNKNDDDDDDDADNQDGDGQEYDVQDDENQDDDNEQNDSDNDGDDFVHPKFSTHDEEDKEEEGSDLRVQTPSHYESTDDEESDEITHGANVEGEELDEEETNEEDEANELYRDVNVNLEGRDTEMTDAPRTIIQTTQVIEDTHVIITQVNPEGQQQSFSVSSGFVSKMLNPSPDTGIDSIFNLNTESTLLVDVPVTTIAELPLLSAIILPPPPTPLITHLQQTPVPTPVTIPSSSLQDLPNFVSSIPDIIDSYLANKMHEAIKTAVQLQSDRLRDEAQAENEDFINKLDDNIKKIIKDQTSHDVAANLSELELKKILIDKMESNKSIHRSDEQKNLYKALVDAYESDKLILDTYGDTVSFKRSRDDEDKDEEPFTGSNRGSKRRRARKEPESTSPQKEKTSKTIGKSTKGSKSHHKPVQPWLSTLAQKEDTRESFNELMDTPLDFLAFVMNRLKVDTLTPELLAGPTFELMKGSCKSLVELEYFFEEVYKATTNKLDWNNPEGQQYPHDLRKSLPLIPNSQGRQVIPFDHFINNDLAYLSGGVSSQTYTVIP
ncbi:hypothetical protein Tco_0435648 [Tanacetum coccineum]